MPLIRLTFKSTDTGKRDFSQFQALHCHSGLSLTQTTMKFPTLIWRPQVEILVSKFAISKLHAKVWMAIIGDKERQDGTE